MVEHGKRTDTHVGNVIRCPDHVADNGRFLKSRTKVKHRALLDFMTDSC